MLVNTYSSCPSFSPLFATASSPCRMLPAAALLLTCMACLITVLAVRHPTLLTAYE